MLIDQNLITKQVRQMMTDAESLKISLMTVNYAHKESSVPLGIAQEMAGSFNSLYNAANSLLPAPVNNGQIFTHPTVANVEVLVYEIQAALVEASFNVTYAEKEELDDSKLLREISPQMRKIAEMSNRILQGLTLYQATAN